MGSGSLFLSRPGPLYKLCIRGRLHSFSRYKDHNFVMPGGGKSVSGGGTNKGGSTYTNYSDGGYSYRNPGGSSYYNTGAGHGFYNNPSGSYTSGGKGYSTHYNYNTGSSSTAYKK